MKTINMWRVWSTWHGTGAPYWTTEDKGYINDDPDWYSQKYEATVPDDWYAGTIYGELTGKLYSEGCSDPIEFAYGDALTHHELRNVTCLMGDTSEMKIEVRLVSDGGHEVER